MSHPYLDLDSRSFWKSAVSEVGPLGLTDLWRPGFRINKTHKIVTAGSCFAQNISSRLVKAGYTWLNTEPGPAFAQEDVKKKYNYGVFSFRTGNIYTAKMLRQWVSFAFGVDEPRIPPIVHNGRYFDPYRQQICPEGFATEEELLASREETFDAIRNAFTQADIFFFTLGLTEAWIDRETKQEYSSCPGVVCGEFDPDRVKFINHEFTSIVADFKAAMKIINENRQSNISVLLTVSPVPLTATASKSHVLVAVTRSKSTLRAAADQIVRGNRRIDYYPSYEVITSPVSRAIHYSSNLRNISPEGVNNVLSYFFTAIKRFDKTSASPTETTAKHASEDEDDIDENDDVVCEEVILNAFAK
ncbi:GSCFA domain-containing protein [Paracoccus sp. PAR01]|uniref:GSCFA domain-containing protein n=1 Tax=Paracoccus sp. PAR01 TaxID=2769282 RepID=UPI001780BC9F|nr:GSCFA domain-containing protein [Paracoccus sp. PAR01]MBD9528247.1 GSCFA domain-containing protein [Paracoccus sp. PAR01]